jgi:hypothetical protein
MQHGFRACERPTRHSSSIIINARVQSDILLFNVVFATSTETGEAEESEAPTEEYSVEVSVLTASQYSAVMPMHKYKLHPSFEAHVRDPCLCPCARAADPGGAGAPVAGAAA